MGAAVAALFAMVGLPAQEARTPVQEVIAAATLAESKGDHEGAKRALEKALTGASEAEQKQLQVALGKLAERAGKAKELYREIQREWDKTGGEKRIREFLNEQGFVRQEQQVDPVRRLIAVLEEGTTDTKAVADAQKQLQELGALAVPPLVAALAKAGPFGLVNAMKVLEPHSDPRIAPALLERANADPAIAALVVEHLERMKRDVRLPIVQVLVQRDLPAETRVNVLDAMEGLPECAAVRKSMALQMATDAKGQGWLLAKLGEWKVDWSGEVLQILRGSSDPGIAAGATSRWLRTDLSVDEATAVAAIEKLEASMRWWVAAEAVRRRPEMARVAMLSIDEFTDWRNTAGGSWFGSGVEWWRQGGAAAVKLLQASKAHPQIDINNALARIIESGWQVSPDLEDTLGQRAHEYLVAALPKDADERALAIWRRLGSYERREFVNKVVEYRRPWHRVVAAQIATAKEWSQVQPHWLERDWSGAPPEAAAALLELAQRFPDPAVGRIVVEGQGTRTTSARPGAWHGSLIAACERTPELPVEIVRIFAKSGDDHAWRVLAKRDPRAALRFAQESKLSGNLGALLAEHGDEGDRPLAKRLLSEQREGTPTTGGLDPGLVRYARQFLAGDLDVCEWASSRMNVPLTAIPLLPLAEQLAAGVRIGQLADFLERLPRLHMNCVDAAMRVLLTQVTSAHVPVLVPALERVLAADPLQDIPVNATLRLIQACAAPACLPALRSALGSPKTARFHATIARTMLACAGDARRATLLELLAANDAKVVNVALLEKDVAADDDLRIAVTNAVHGKRAEVTSLDALFAQYEPAAATAFARALVSSPSFVDFGSEAAMSIVHALGAGRDPHEVAVLAQATRHAHPHVRQAATEQLVRMFDAKAAPHLLELLKDDDAGVRQLAKDGLYRLGEYLDEQAKWNERLNRK